MAPISTITALDRNRHYNKVTYSLTFFFIHHSFVVPLVVITTSVIFARSIATNTDQSPVFIKVQNIFVVGFQ